MATQAQINANKENSQKSTGPRTAKGKKAVSQNAVKHGFFTREAVIRDEDQADFDRYSEAMLAEMAPVGHRRQAKGREEFTLNMMSSSLVAKFTRLRLSYVQ